jgi:hypothetical protein
MARVYCIEAAQRRVAGMRAQKADRHVNNTLENLRAESLPKKDARVPTAKTFHATPSR